MKHEYLPRSLPVKAFAQAAGELKGSVALKDLDRLREESLGPVEGVQVHYVAQGEMLEDVAGQPEPWVHLSGATVLVMTCQRCLGPVETEVSFERSFRFVATEALAEVEDEESEEDVLVLSREFNLLDLVEDELLMAIPPVPKHLECPTSVKLEAVDADFDDSAAQKPNPFAVLQQLKK
jgi:uncharacterized protein